MNADRAAVRAAVRAAAEADLSADLASAAAPSDLHQVAMSPWLNAGIAERLHATDIPAVVAELASNVVAPPELLTQLLTHREAVVRGSAERNPACPFAAVAALGGVHPVVHPDCPEFLVVDAVHTLETTRGLRLAALTHPNLPVEERRQAAKTLGETAVLDLLANPSCTHDEAVEMISAATRMNVSATLSQWATHPNADPDWLRATYLDHVEHNHVVAAIASNPSTPVDVLNSIHPSQLQDYRALENPSLPVGVMLSILDETDRPHVHYWLMRNPAADSRVLARIDVSHCERDDLYDLLNLHGVDAAHVNVTLAALANWDGNLAGLLEASYYISR